MEGHSHIKGDIMKLSKKIMKDRYAYVSTDDVETNNDLTIYELHPTKEGAYKEIGQESGTNSEKRQIEIGKSLVGDGYYRIITVKGRALKK